MKRVLWMLVFLLVPFSGRAGESVKVKVQKSTVYEEPQFYARVVYQVGYGQTMEMVEQRGDWVQVELQGKTGWIHKSSLTSDKIDLGTILFGGGSGEATYDEVTLAGKGFTPEIERAYRQDRANMNYAAVDMIERFEVYDRELVEFIDQGGLRVREE